MLTDVIPALPEYANTAELRDFARTVLDRHRVGQTMASGVQLCTCGALLDSCLYRNTAYRCMNDGPATRLSHTLASDVSDVQPEIGAST